MKNYIHKKDIPLRNNQAYKYMLEMINARERPFYIKQNLLTFFCGSAKEANHVKLMLGKVYEDTEYDLIYDGNVAERRRVKKAINSYVDQYFAKHKIKIYENTTPFSRR